jgi:hypothetical protein
VGGVEMNAVQGADMTILSAGLVHNDLISEGYHSIRKEAHSSSPASARTKRTVCKASTP